MWIVKRYKQKNLDWEKAKQEAYHLKQKRNKSPEQEKKAASKNLWVQTD